MTPEIDTDFLIFLMKSHPILWDKTCPPYKDRKQTKQAWKEICNDLNDKFNTLNDEEQDSIGKEVLERWVNIRDSYQKSLRKEKIKRKYIYNDQLSFLSETFESSTNTSSKSIVKPDEEKSTTTPATVTEEKQDDDYEANVPGKTLDRTAFNSRKRKLDEIDLKLLKALEEPENRHISFFKGVIPSLNTFTENEVLQFQAGVLQSIINIKRGREAWPVSFRTNQSKNTHTSQNSVEIKCEYSSSPDNSERGSSISEEFKFSKENFHS